MLQKYFLLIHNYLYTEDSNNLLHKSLINNQTHAIIRLFCFIYLTIVYIWTLVFMKNILENILYLTLQGYFITWLYFALTVEDYYFTKYFKTQMFKGLWKICSILYQLALCAEVPITIVFWGFLFKILLQIPGVNANAIALNANLHAGPFICLIIELFFNCNDFRKPHYTVIFIFSFLYMIINMVYSVSVRPIYRPIDWVSVLSYVLVISCFVFTYATHALGRYYFDKIKKSKLELIEFKQNLNIQSEMGYSDNNNL